MFTQCPQCNAIFQVTASQLKAAGGDVRCGQCLSVFNALHHLSEEVPHAPETEPTDELAHDAHQYRDWSEEKPAEIKQDPTSTDAPTTPHTEIDDEVDVFSEVIAEVSANNIPAVELERFEKFLATEPLPAEDVSSDETTPLAEVDFPIEDSPSAEGSNFTEGSIFAEGSPQPEGAPPAEDTLHHPVPAEDSFPSEEVLLEDGAAQTEDIAPNSTRDTDTVIDTPPDEASVPTDETGFGDIDIVTADLDAEISIDDDEFAELDAYLNGPDDAPVDRLARPEDKTGHDEDAIIIEDADLEPMTSAAYTDSPATAAKQPADTPAADTVVPPEGTAETPADAPQTINIPTLILDDLQAAKAEQLRPSNTPWVIGSLVLMLTLALQVVYHNRDELANDVSLRPWLIQMCELVGCTLSQPYDIQKIEIIGRDVRSHPTARKALVVSTTLINNASFVQPFPLLTMTFSDINGTKIAQRRFTPREYLHNDVDLAAGMTPDMPVRVELELVDPGKAAVNYEFRAEADPRRTRPLT